MNLVKTLRYRVTAYLFYLYTFIVAVCKFMDDIVFFFLLKFVYKSMLADCHSCHLLICVIFTSVFASIR